MLDIKLIRQDPQKIKDTIIAKKEKGDVDKIIDLDNSRRSVIAESEKLKAEKNKASKEIGLAKKNGKSPKEAIANMQHRAQKIKEYDTKLHSLDLQLKEKILEIPNIIHESVPKGENENDNVVERKWGQIIPKSFSLKNHIQISEELNILDFKRGAKLSGSGFVIYKNLGAKLERALINYFLDSNTQKGFTEVLTPFMVNPYCAEGTGQLPKSRDQMYYVNEDNMFLIPTAEVPVTNIFRDEILNYKDLPIYYTAYSPCFRREAGSWGKDTRGFLRVHQFNKVEMVKFVEPQNSYNELEHLVSCSEELLKGLNLPYRILSLCSGDLSFAAAKCYDIEVYAPGEDKWLEVSSCSNFEDFQARRANIKYRNKNGKTEFVHTLNGSGLATARIIVAILENYQNEDGSVTVPDVLVPYMNNTQIIKK